MGFSFEPEVTGIVEDGGYSSERPKGFIRSKKDNTLFTDLQMKDIGDILTEDCINYIDADGIAYKTASSVEDDYIEVFNKETEEVKEYKNTTEFRGRTKKVAQDSVLGTLNIKREAEGKTPYTEEDFTIVKKKRLKHEKGATIDDNKFDNTEEVMKYYIDEWISAIKVQTQVKNILCVLGEGKCHRNNLLLPEEYKSNRKGERPLLLSKAREYILDAYPSELAPEGYETDEIVDGYAFKHYLTYRKTGKVSGIKTSPDKDAMACPGFLFQGTKAFTFDQPQIWKIDATDKDVGRLEISRSKVKATGLINICWLMLLADKSDHYGARHTMPADVRPTMPYGDVAFYKEFLPLRTPQEVLQATVNKFYEFYPKGVKYTAWEGTEVDEDTLWWLEQNFACAYMKRQLDDNTKIVDLLDHFKVDYKQLVGNNKQDELPLADEEDLRSNIKDIRESLSALQDKSGVLSYKKSEKKDVLTDRLDKVSKEIKNIESMLDNFYVGE